jgi:hypothetical protein
MKEKSITFQEVKEAHKQGKETRHFMYKALAHFSKHKDGKIYYVLNGIEPLFPEIFLNDVDAFVVFGELSSLKMMERFEVINDQKTISSEAFQKLQNGEEFIVEKEGLLSFTIEENK